MNEKVRLTLVIGYEIVRQELDMGVRDIVERQ